MFAPDANSDSKKPVPWSTWKHEASGKLYTVIAVTSDPDEGKEDKYPVTVLYRGTDERDWSRTLDDFLANFTLVQTSLPPSFIEANPAAEGTFFGVPLTSLSHEDLRRIINYMYKEKEYIVAIHRSVRAWEHG